MVNVVLRRPTKEQAVIMPEVPREGDMLVLDDVVHEIISRQWRQRERPPTGKRCAPSGPPEWECVLILSRR